MKDNLMLVGWCVLWLALGWCVATRIVVDPPPVEVRSETVAELPGPFTELSDENTTGTIYFSVSDEAFLYQNDFWPVFGPGKPGDVFPAFIVREADGSWNIPMPGTDTYEKAAAKMRETTWSPATPIRATDGGEPRIERSE